MWSGGMSYGPVLSDLLAFPAGEVNLIDTPGNAVAPD